MVIQIHFDEIVEIALDVVHLFKKTNVMIMFIAIVLKCFVIKCYQNTDGKVVV